MPKEKLSNPEFNTVLNLLASNAAPEVKRKLFEKYSIDAYEETTGKTLLYAACEKVSIYSQSQYKTAIKFLLEQGADVNKKDNKDTNPLWLVARGDLEATQWLVRKGANTNHLSQHSNANYTSLYAAADHGQTAIVECLLASGAQPNLRSGTPLLAPLYIAAQKGYVPTIRALLRGGADVNILTAHLETPLLTAVDNLKIEASEVLLAEGKASLKLVDDKKRSPLYLLVTQANKHKAEMATVLAMLRLLHRFKADLNEIDNEGYTLLANAIIDGNLELVEELLHLGADPHQLIPIQLTKMNSHGKEIPANCSITPLAFAALRGKNAIVKCLLRTDAQHDINISDSLQRTALYFASHFGHDKVIEILLAAGADPNIANDEGFTPLCAACENGHREAFKLLLKHKKTEVNKAAIDGCTPLHKAVQLGFFDFVRLLVVYDASINVCAQDGATPLLIAAQEGHETILSLLLEKGGDPEIYRKDGGSPLFLAYLYGHKACLKLLLEVFYKKYLPGKSLIEYEVLSDIVNSNQQRVIYLLTNFETPTPPVSIAPQSFFKPTAKPASNITPAAAFSSFVSESAPKLSQSGYAFLKKHGFTRENILAMRHKKDEKEKPNATALVDIELPPEKITWFGGLINATMQGIDKIDRGSHKAKNCYLYLDEKTLVEQAANLTVFRRVPLKLCAGEGEQGINKLKGETPGCSVIVNGKEYIYPITHELKVHSTAERVYCIKVKSDDGRCTLLVGIRYSEKGLHTTKERNAIFSQLVKAFTLNLPTNLMQTPELTSSLQR